MRIELGDRAGRGDPQARARSTSNGGQPRSAMSISRRSGSCGSENSQVPPASQASPALQRRQLGALARPRDFCDVFRSMASERCTIHAVDRRRCAGWNTA